MEIYYYIIRSFDKISFDFLENSSIVLKNSSVTFKNIVFKSSFPVENTHNFLILSQNLSNLTFYVNFQKKFNFLSIIKIRTASSKALLNPLMPLFWIPMSSILSQRRRGSSILRSRSPGQRPTALILTAESMPSSRQCA